MQKILLLFTLLFSTVVANELKTISSYQNALYKAKSADKLVLVMMSYDGCPVCDYMKDIVFERAQVLDYLNQNFYVVIKDLEKDKYPQRFSSIDTPTFFFIHPKTKKDVIEKKVGGFKPDRFLYILKEATGELVPVTENQTPEHNQSIIPCDKNQECKKQTYISL